MINNKAKLLCAGIILFFGVILLGGCKKNGATENGSPDAAENETMTDGNEAPADPETADKNDTAGSDNQTAGSDNGDTANSDDGGVTVYDGYELCTAGNSDSAGHYSTDGSFSEGLAWTGYRDENGDEYIGIIDEEGKLIFSEKESKLIEFMEPVNGSTTFRNTLFEDGVSALYTNDSFIIFDKQGAALCAAIESEDTKYHLMGYGDGLFPIIKTVKEITGEELEFLYAIDKTGKVVSIPSVWQDGYGSGQHASYLGNGTFTDGVSLFDLNSHENYYFSGYIGGLDGSDSSLSLQDWIKIADETDIANELESIDSAIKAYFEYPQVRAYGYYGTLWGYDIKEKVYENTITGPIDTHHIFISTDGTILGDISGTVDGKKVERVGLYSGGYVPVELSDDEDKYITVLDMNGTPIYEPVSETENEIYGWAGEVSYKGYTAVYSSKSKCTLTIITPDGELKRMGDDLSALGDEAYMYTRSGCFVANGYISDLNLDGGDLWYEKDNEWLDNVYVSLDGKTVIKGAALTASTRTLNQDINIISKEYADSSAVLKDSLSKSSLIFDNELAKILACMSEKSEDETPDDIIELYELCGLSDIQDDNYDSDGGASAIARTKLLIDGTETDVLVITCRGSVTIEEFIGDGLKGRMDEFEGELVYDNVNDMTDKVWAALQTYLQKYPDLKDSDNLKIIINGHSLGGACASMVAAKVDNLVNSSQLFNKNVTMEDVYVYTFGGIEVFAENTNVSEGYENIHNLYNRYDAFGPEGNYAIFGASSCNAKFGHTEMFELDLEKGALTNINHWMSTYKSALEMNDIYDGFIDYCNK